MRTVCGTLTMSLCRLWQITHAYMHGWLGSTTDFEASSSCEAAPKDLPCTIHHGVGNISTGVLTQGWASSEGFPGSVIHSSTLTL